MWVGRKNIDAGDDPSAAHRQCWNDNSHDYIAEMLGELGRARVLEFSCGAAQCAPIQHPIRPVGSFQILRHANP